MKRPLFLVLGMLAAACAEDDDPTDVGLDGGTMDASIVPTSDGGPDAATDAGDAATAALCAKYGGAPGVERAVKQFVLEDLARDCVVGAHLRTLSANRLARFGDCFTFQVQELFACPGVTYAGSKSPNGLPCRDTQAAHAGLALRAADYDAVIADVAAGLAKAGIAQADIDRITPALTGLDTEIIESADAPPALSCEPDAGTPDAGG